jgi:hypothetical protein
MNDNESTAFDYKTHILISCSSDGKMIVKSRDIPAVYAHRDLACEGPRAPRAAISETAQLMGRMNAQMADLFVPERDG